MHRRYDTALFKAKIEKIKQILPDAFIGVDVIVGTRGETPEYFEETHRFLEDLPFSQLHVFPYSERPGTMALKIQQVVTPQEKQERSKILQELSDRKLADFYRSQIGTRHPVLFEHTNKNNKMFGFTDNYVKVETEYNATFVNQIIEIELDELNVGKV
jgi:threonylcarbamoyladenosine tRNA methylthiotransferase MtaB